MSITLDIPGLPIGGTQGLLQGTNLRGEHTRTSGAVTSFESREEISRDGGSGGESMRARDRKSVV